MIRKANEKDKTALREIWSAAFEDPLSYADFVVDHCLKLGTVLYDDRGRSFLTCFPLSLQKKGQILLQGFYIYGFATHPSRQGKGFGSRLLARAVRDTSFCLLYPATLELQRFYHKRGFITPVRIPAALSRQLPVPDFQEIQSELIYRQYVEDANHLDFVFLWSSSMFKFALDECLFRKGFVNIPWFCYPEDGQTHCKLFLSPDDPGAFSYIKAWGMFKDPVPGFEPEKSIFYLPLD